MSTPKNMRLRAVPEDIREILLREQANKKIKCKCQYSLEQTIYMLIRQAVKLPEDSVSA